MIYVENTPNNLGVAIYGDYNDLEKLYDSLHNIVGDENQHIPYELPRLRVLGLCYDIRHAMQGDREYEFVPNGMSPEIMRYRGMITPENNLYLKVYALWPEILFIQMVLNEFIVLYGKERSKEYFDLLIDKNNIWDESIAHVRVFQAAVNKCIQATVTEAAYKRMLSKMSSKYNQSGYYITQYIDYLNIKFTEMDKEKRLKNISIMAKRILEKGQEYRNIEEEIYEAVKEYQCPVDRIRLNMEYPDEYEW